MLIPQRIRSVHSDVVATKVRRLRIPRTSVSMMKTSSKLKNSAAQTSSVGIQPEETVRQLVIRQLKQLGWEETRLRWKPEWQIPDTPHDLTKRERGQKYAVCGSTDLAAVPGN